MPALPEAAFLISTSICVMETGEGASRFTVCWEWRRQEAAIAAMEEELVALDSTPCPVCMAAVGSRCLCVHVCCVRLSSQGLARAAGDGQ